MRAPVHLLHNALYTRLSKWNELGLFPVKPNRRTLAALSRYLSRYQKRELSYPEDISNGMLSMFVAFRQGLLEGTYNGTEH